MKKILSFLIVAMLLFAVSAVALAENNGRITVTNAVNGQFYTLYRLLDADVVDGRAEGGAGIRYYSNTYTPGADAPFEADAAGNITFKAEALDNGGQLTQETITWIKSNLDLFTKVESVAAANGEAVWADLPDGYYFINTTTGTLVTITSIQPDMSVEDKNLAPELTKLVKGGDADDFVSANTADIGDELTYKVTIVAQPGAMDYVVTDTVTSGLTLLDASNVTAECVLGITGSDYSAVVENNTMTISIDQDFLDRITAETQIVFTYKASVNVNAAVGETGNGNVNRAVLKYGATSVENHDEYEQSETPPATTTTRTFAFGLYKTDANHKIIDGARFTLYAENQTDVIDVVASGSGYRVALDGETGVAIEAGHAEISGLQNGTYYLVETEAPAGYNKLTEPVEVVINNANRLGTQDGDAYVITSNGVGVVNQMGAELPRTGGVGTTMLYVGGAVLLLSAAVILIARRRAAEESK